MIVYDDHLDLEMESFKEIILSRIKLFNKKEGMRLLIDFESDTKFSLYLIDDMLIGWIALERIISQTYHIQVFSRISFYYELSKFSWFIIEAYKGIETASKYFSEVGEPKFQPAWILPYDEFEAQYMKTIGFGALITQMKQSSEQSTELREDNIEAIDQGKENSHIGEPVIKHSPTAGKNIVNIEPWRKSPPKKQVRDKAIWEFREAGNTWEDVADAANCAVSTAKDNYFRMKKKEISKSD
jgi:hypothetical protein